MLEKLENWWRNSILKKLASSFRKASSPKWEGGKYAGGILLDYKLKHIQDTLPFRQYWSTSAFFVLRNNGQKKISIFTDFRTFFWEKFELKF